VSGNKLIKFPGQACRGNRFHKVLSMVDPHHAERDELIMAHIPLVPVIAKNMGKRYPPWFTLDDLKGPGYLGLVKAGHGFNFRTIRRTRARSTSVSRRMLGPASRGKSKAHLRAVTGPKL
jgi:hypothetical protein